MEAEVDRTSANVAKLHAVTNEGLSMSRTDDSIQPNVTLTVVDIDQQSAQFACELTISNLADDDFQVGQIRPRLPSGVTLNEAVDTAQAERLRTYDDICRSMEQVLTAAVLLSNQGIFKQQVVTMRDMIKTSLNARDLFELYLSILLLRTPEVVKQFRDRSFKVNVRCSKDISIVLDMFFSNSDANPDVQLARYNMRLLAEMEQSEDFHQSQQDVTLKRGQQYKIVYILRGTRGYINSLPFSISFEIPFRRGAYAISRMEYVRISVPPGSTWPSVTAMLSAAIGSYIQRFGPGNASAPFFDAERLDNISSLSSAAGSLIVPMLTAVVVYNIYDLTALKDKFQTKRGWRSAVLVGFFCGFLNEKVLKALAVLFQ